MANVPYMNKEISAIKLMQSRFETINKTMRQISDETYSVHHHSLLFIWQPNGFLSSIKRHEQFVLRLKSGT